MTSSNTSCRGCARRFQNRRRVHGVAWAGRGQMDVMRLIVEHGCDQHLCNDYGCNVACWTTMGAGGGAASTCVPARAFRFNKRQRPQHASQGCPARKPSRVILALRHPTLSHHRSPRASGFRGIHPADLASSKVSRRARLAHHASNHAPIHPRRPIERYLISSVIITNAPHATSSLRARRVPSSRVSPARDDPKPARLFPSLVSPPPAPPLRAQHLPDDGDALPILGRAPVHARVLPDVQIALFKLFIDALFITRADEPVEELDAVLHLLTRHGERGVALFGRHRARVRRGAHRGSRSVEIGRGGRRGGEMTPESVVRRWIARESATGATAGNRRGERASSLVVVSRRARASPVPNERRWRIRRLQRTRDERRS